MTNTSPVEYAETKLGIHQTWQAVLEAQQELRKLHAERAAVTVQVRNAQARSEDIETDVTQIHRELANKSERKISVAEFERGVKEALPLYDEWRELRSTIRKGRNQLDVLDSSIKIFEAEIRTGSARMRELGGYLDFLAACKNAETAARQMAVASPADRWPF